MPQWVQTLVKSIQGLIHTLITYRLGQSQVTRQQLEERLEIQKHYEKLDERNKVYRDRGKSGLLERLRKRQKPS